MPRDWPTALRRLREENKIPRRVMREKTGDVFKETMAERYERKTGPKSNEEEARVVEALRALEPEVPWLAEFLADGSTPAEAPAEDADAQLVLPGTGDELSLEEQIAQPGDPTAEDLIPVCGPCALGHHIACRNFQEGNTLGGVCCDGWSVGTATDAGVTAGMVQANEQANPVIVLDEDDDPENMLAYVAPLEGDAPFLMSNGQRASWQRCRRQWWLAWYKQLAPRVENLTNTRATGDRIHRALAMWYVAPEDQPVDPRDALERVIVQDWTTMLRSLGREPGDEGEYEDSRVASFAQRFQQACTLERAMVAGYMEWLTETGADSDYDVVGSEVTLVGDLKDEQSDRIIRVIGLLDARLRRRQDDVRLYVDHKTVDSLTDQTPTLPQNEQMLHYLLVEWLNTPEGEARCDGALYNMLRRVKRSPQAKPPFYDRLEVPHNVWEIASYKRRLLAAARDIQRATELLDAGVDPLDVVYPTPRKECKFDCDFFSICRLFDDGSRVDDALDALFVQVDPVARYDRVAIYGHDADK